MTFCGVAQRPQITVKYFKTSKIFRIIKSCAEEKKATIEHTCACDCFDDLTAFLQPLTHISNLIKKVYPKSEIRIRLEFGKV